MPTPKLANDVKGGTVEPLEGFQKWKDLQLKGLELDGIYSPSCYDLCLKGKDEQRELLKP